MNKSMFIVAFISSCLLLSKVEATATYKFINETGFDASQITVKWYKETDTNNPMKEDKFKPEMKAPQGACFLKMFVTVGHITNGFMDKVPKHGVYLIKLMKAGKNGFAAVQTASCETEGCTLNS